MRTNNEMTQPPNVQQDLLFRMRIILVSFQWYEGLSPPQQTQVEADENVGVLESPITLPSLPYEYDGSMDKAQKEAAPQFKKEAALPSYRLAFVRRLLEEEGAT